MIWPGGPRGAVCDELVESAESGACELYDVESDPGEILNLWDDPRHFEARAELTHRLLLFTMGCGVASSFATDAEAGKRLDESAAWKLHRGRIRWGEYVGSGRPR